MARSVIFVSAAAIVAAGAFVLFRFDPTVVHFYPRCVFHAITGLQCPGCGSTRALHHLLHGDVAGAFRLNPFLFLAGAFAASATISRRIATSPVIAWTAAGFTIAWWIVRNLPFWPW